MLRPRSVKFKAVGRPKRLENLRHSEFETYTSLGFRAGPTLCRVLRGYIGLRQGWIRFLYDAEGLNSYEMLGIMGGQMDNMENQVGDAPCTGLSRQK